MSASWQERIAHCLLCGDRLQHREVYGARRPACGSCDYVHFRETASAAAAVVAHGRRLLMVRRAIQPYQGHWGFPGGFQEYGESLADTAVREVQEETGMEIVVRRLLDLLYTTDDPRKRVNTAVFLAVPRESSLARGPSAADDATDARWFALDELPEPIAFANNLRVVDQLRESFPEGDIH